MNCKGTMSRQTDESVWRKMRANERKMLYRDWKSIQSWWWQKREGESEGESGGG